MRELSAEQTKKTWQGYYALLTGGEKSEYFQGEFRKYVGTHTWENSIRIVVELCGIQNGDSILDAGCGWGRILLGLVEKYENLNVTAIDLTEDAINTGKEVIGEEVKGNKIKWVQGNLQKLEFEDNSFDVVYSSRVFQHLNHPEKGINEVIRVLKPGGKFIIFLPNKLCPLNMCYYSRLYSPASVKLWFKGVESSELHLTTMDFYPYNIPIKFSLGSRMKFERMFESIPILNKFGGKVVVWGVK